MAGEGRLGTELNREIIIRGFVIEEVLLDHLPFVPQTQHEILEPVVRVELHDVPEDRPISHLHERLGFELALLTQARALSAAENDDFHENITLIALMG